MTEKAIMLMVILVTLAGIIVSICLDHYETGLHVGYEKGLEDGIRLTNEVNEEEQK